MGNNLVSLELWQELFGNISKGIGILPFLLLIVSLFAIKKEAMNQLWSLLFVFCIAVSMRGVLHFASVIDLSKRYFAPLAVLVTAVGVAGFPVISAFLESKSKKYDSRKIMTVFILFILFAFGSKAMWYRTDKAPYRQLGEFLCNHSAGRSFAVIADDDARRKAYYAGSTELRYSVDKLKYFKTWKSRGDLPELMYFVINETAVGFNESVKQIQKELGLEFIKKLSTKGRKRKMTFDIYLYQKSSDK